MIINITYLQNIWFILWCIIWGYYFILDSFTLGTGILSIKNINDDSIIELMIKTISPFWGGNQVWLILAAGGTFAAFPIIFSKMFTWLYLPMMLLLFGLIIRGLSIELLHNDIEKRLRHVLKLSWFIGSLIITIVLGLFFSNLFYGLLIGSNYNYYGTFFSLINKYTIFGTLIFFMLVLLSGSLWLSNKMSDVICYEYWDFSKKIIVFIPIILTLFIVASFNINNFSINYNEHILLYILPIISLVSSLINFYLIKYSKLLNNYKLLSLILNFITIIFLLFAGFATLHPYILKSSIDISYGLSIYNSSSSELTLTLMLFSSIIFVPIVITYQLYSYFIFKEK